MKQKNLLINGYFLCRPLTGIERYACEITKRLDELILPGEISLIVPADAKNIPQFKNIHTIYYGKTIQHVMWQMFTLQFFLLRHRQYIILDFGNTCLPLFPGIIFLHDIYCEFFPGDFSGLRNKIARLYNRWQYRVIAKKAKRIVTVSNFTKNQIIDNFYVDPKNISVIFSSWEHFNSVSPDYSVFKDYPSIKKNQYYFSLGSLSKRKNIRWIIEYAKKDAHSFFVISGVSLSTVKADELDYSMPQNILLLGYLDDSKVKALMEGCKAFILPSYYEGFGLTPLEALSCGAKIIVAKAASLPEIYGNTAHYIDPFDTNIDLDLLLDEPVEPPEDILRNYSYDTAAKQVNCLINEIV